MKFGLVSDNDPCFMGCMNQKLNGTECQWTPKYISCDRAIRHSGLGVGWVGPVGDFMGCNNDDHPW